MLESIPSCTDTPDIQPNKLSSLLAPMPDVVPQNDSKLHPHQTYYCHPYYQQQLVHSPRNYQTVYYHDNFNGRCANRCSPYSQLDCSLRFSTPRCSSVPLSIDNGRGLFSSMNLNHGENNLDFFGRRMFIPSRARMTNNHHLTSLARQMAYIGDQLEMQHSSLVSVQCYFIYNN